MSETDLLEAGPPPDGAADQVDLRSYAQPDLRQSMWDLATSVVPFLALWALMFVAFSVSYWLVLLLAYPTAGFLVRTYILFHDCVHGSFLQSRRADAWVGSVLALLVLTPFARWRYEHLVHHATAGDLDRRGVGDVPVLTVAEYQAKSWPGRLGYRLIRNPVVLFGLAPIYSTVIMQRIPNPIARQRLHRSVWVTNLAVVVLVAALCLAFGWQAVLFVELPLVVLAGGVGLWLFYVQHQYPTSYWVHADDWDYTDAALHGSSYLRLPRFLQFFTGNIGFHHVHHLNPKIPNYNLQQAHEEQPIFRAVQPLTIWEALKSARLKLFDEASGRLVTWSQVPPRATSAAASTR